MKTMNHCPVCSAVQTQPTPFCRKCGADLRAVQMALDKPDIVTGAAGRDEVLRAIADKVRQLPANDDLGKIAEEVLGEVEKVLEMPAERRLREIRDGVRWATFGLGLALYFALQETLLHKTNWPLLGAIVALATGLGYFINGLWFTTPGHQQKDKLAELSARMSEPLPTAEPRATDKSLAAASVEPLATVTEDTTRRLVAEPQTDKS